MLERVDRRVLGAIEFVDVISGTRVRDPLQVDAPTLTLRANRSALYVIHAAQGLEDFAAAFDAQPAAVPAPLPDYDLVVRDPARRYLARAARIALPRNSTAVTDPDSVLQPARITLYPGAARAVDPQWAALRVFVFVASGAEKQGVANALVRLTPALAGAGVSFALTDANGEALLAVPAAPPVLPAGGASDSDPDVVYTRTFAAALRVVLDAAVTRAGGTRPLPVPDPDRMQSRLAAGNAAVKSVDAPDTQLSAGVVQRAEVAVTL